MPEENPILNERPDLRDLAALGVATCFALGTGLLVVPSFLMVFVTGLSASKTRGQGRALKQWVQNMWLLLNVVEVSAVTVGITAIVVAGAMCVVSSTGWARRLGRVFLGVSMALQLVCWVLFVVLFAATFLLV